MATKASKKTESEDPEIEEEEEEDKKEQEETADSSEAILEAIGGLNTSLTAMNDRIAKLEKPVEIEKPPAPNDDLNPDMMTGQQLLDASIKAGQKILKEALDEVNANVRILGDHISNQGMVTQVKELNKTHPDLKEWGDEIKEIATKTPGLSIKQMYLLAKDSNPSKVEKLTKKYKKNAEEGSGVGDNNSRKFGGLRPGAPRRGSKHPAKMNVEKAGETAFEEIFGAGS